MKSKIKLSTATLLISALLAGCGSSSSDDTSTVQTDTNTGYLIDAEVYGADYVTTSGIRGTTDIYGKFQYKTGDKVKFTLGELDLGEAIPSSDGLVTPETLVVGDNNTLPTQEQEETITLLLQTLQSLDSDNNPSNGITISNEVKEKLSQISSLSFSDLNETDLIALDQDYNLGLDEDHDGFLDVNKTTAEAHFRSSTSSWEHGHKPDSFTSSGVEFSIDNYAVTQNLTQELKDALAHMGNEERLAHDVYMNLYNYHLNNGLDIAQLYNIASGAEENHVNIVQSLVRRYDINNTELSDVNSTIINDNNMSKDLVLENMPSGVFDIPAIQDLYNTLYAIGQGSQEEALKVGCMVEVTDINDLDKYVQEAEESEAFDIADAFKTLRAGSYNHYWSFDQALKNIGIENGCYFEGDPLLGQNKEGIYPKKEDSSTSMGNGEMMGDGDGNCTSDSMDMNNTSQGTMLQKGKKH